MVHLEEVFWVFSIPFKKIALKFELKINLGWNKNLDNLLYYNNTIAI